MGYVKVYDRRRNLSSAEMMEYTEGGAPAMVFYGAEDPGAVGAGAIWLLHDGESGSYELYIRTEEDDGWATPTIKNDRGIIEVDANAITITITGEGGVGVLGRVRVTDAGEVVISAEAGGFNEFKVLDDGLSVLSLPSSDPGEAGLMYTAGAPGPGDPKALMVSGGPA